MVAFAQVQAKQEPIHYDEDGSANDAGIWHFVRTSDRSSRATSLFHPILSIDVVVGWVLYFAIYRATFVPAWNARARSWAAKNA